jgi:ABC-type antimicrobial peptide transport system permease subunit
MPIIGVVADAKNRTLTDTPKPELYTPGLGTYSNLSFRSEVTIVVRAQGDASSIARPLQKVIADVAPDAATYEVESLEDVVREAGARMSTTTKLMAAYAISAFLLAIAGVYAVLSYLVNQRRHELAVRRALGAPSSAILHLVTMESARVVGIGAILGILGAFLTARLLSGLLFGVGSIDPVVSTVVVIIVGIGAVGAAVVPALRAVRVDPNAALRSR